MDAKEEYMLLSEAALSRLGRFSLVGEGRSYLRPHILLLLMALVVLSASHFSSLIESLLRSKFFKSEFSVLWINRTSRRCGNDIFDMNGLGV